MEKVYQTKLFRKETKSFISEHKFDVKMCTGFKEKIKQILLNFMEKYKMIEKSKTETDNYTRVTVDFRSVMSLVDGLIRDEMYKYGISGDNFSLLIGYDYLRKLEMELHEQYIFNMPLELKGNMGLYKGYIKLILAPNIDGVYVLKNI